MSITTTTGGFNDNGAWNAGRGGFTALSGHVGSMSFTFCELVAGVGGFINYAVRSAAPFSDSVLSIYDDGDALIESFNITADAPISNPSGLNAGAFRGFEVASVTIRRFELTNAMSRSTI